MTTNAATPLKDVFNVRAGGIRLIFAVILVVQYVLAIVSIGGVDSPWPVIAALLVYTAGVLLVAAPHPEPYPRRWVALVLLSSIAINALVLWNLPRGSWPAYADWNFGAAVWLCFFLALRGRSGSAWLGWFLMAALTQLWSWTVGETPLQSFSHVVRHIATVVVAVLFRVLLVRASVRLAALREERVARVAIESSSLAEIRERSRQAVRLDEGARAALEQIAAGDYLGDERQRGYGLLEAKLRDMLRGGDLVSSKVAQAVDEARLRGVEVVLLDDRNVPLSELKSLELEAALVSELAEFREGRVTARLLPAGREFFASVVGDSRRLRRRVDLLDASVPPVRVPPEVF